ncbi:MAG: rod shape-determining protein MreD [Bacteroidia bacterium]
MTNKLLLNSLRFVFLILLQALVVKNINFGMYLILLPYILIILSLPFETPKLLVLGLSFFTGFTMDIFYSTPGLHASACSFMGFARHYIMALVAPRDGYDESQHPSIEVMGFEWFAKYAGILIFIHHLAFFFLETFRLNETFHILFRTLLSTLGTFVLVALLQYLFNTNRFRRK